MAFITAYFDESYASPNPDVYTVAGYISTDRRWIKWQKAWKAALEEDLLSDWQAVYGDERPLAFHMTDFANQYDKVYGKWTGQRKIDFLKRLHAITKQYYLRSFSTGIIVADYEALNVKEKSFLGTPHVCAAVNCVKKVAEWAISQEMHDRILYVFERGRVDDADLRRTFQIALSEDERRHYRMEKLAFDNKINMPPLQAADSLAYETRKEFSRSIDSNNTRDVRRSIQNLAVPTLDEWYVLDAPEFTKIFDRRG